MLAKRTFLCLLPLLIAGAAIAEQQVLWHSPGGSSFELLAREGDALRFRVDLGELVAEERMSPEGIFTRLTIPGFHHSREVGEPELPLMNRLIHVPHGATASIEILSTTSREIDLAAQGFASPLWPAQASVAKDADLANLPFVRNAGSYRSSPIANDMVSVVDMGRLRAVQIGRLEISPIAYYPDEQILVLQESIEFRVSFSGGDPFREAELAALTNSPFFVPIYDQIMGYRGVHDNYPDVVRDLVTMVVLVPPEFEYQMQEFVDWKTERGFKVILAVKDTPEVGSTKEQIRDYIHGLYNNATPELPAPSFVLFVGDIAQMPTFTEGGDATDRPYCDVEGDLVPDIYYGRFSATNPTHLQNILDKTLMYDQYTMADPSYLEEVVMIAGMDSGYGATHGNGQINYGTTYYFNEAHGIYSHTYLYPNSGANAANIVQNVSDGVAFINYTAHGSTTAWSDPSFTQSNINNLMNSGQYCTAIGNCCLTSSYEIGECFAETWLRAQDKGAIGYIGASNSTYWDEDYWFGVGAGTPVANPVYENFGMGAYDGAFHDHGEDMAQWYVVNDALIFSGNLAVMEGNGMVTYYWNVYNLMGDPSLSTYMGVPEPNPVAHLSTIYTNSTELSIDAVPGSYCGLTKEGVLIGAGTVDAMGHLDMEIWDNLLPGPANLCVMMQNCEPYQAAINVIVPAIILIDPAVIDANVATTVTVGIFESDGVTPKVGINVWAEGLDYATAPVVTGADGYCSFDVNYAYGPSVDICGQDPGDAWLLFRNLLEVNATPLNNVSLRVANDVGTTDSFPLNLESALEAYIPFGGGELPPHLLWCFMNDLPGISDNDGVVEVTPTQLGSVRGVFAVSGYDLVQATFPIVEVFGTLGGHVDAEGSAANGAIVQGFDAEGEIAFTATANALGDYTVSGDILVAGYTISVDYFGYYPYDEPFFVDFGANVYDIDLLAAPAGVLTGTVTDADSGMPLEATVKVYRTDTMELYDEVTTDGMSGVYTTGALPFFDYEIYVRASQHVPVTEVVTIDSLNVVRDWALLGTLGDILLLDDTDRGKALDFEEKPGEMTRAEYLAADAKTLTDLVTDLEELGYGVIVEAMGSTNSAEWENYDMLLSCSGDNIGPIASSVIRNALIGYVAGGGRLLIEGGEVGYDHYSSGTFASQVLHITDWDHDSSGSVTVVQPNHHVVSVPNVITGPISMTYDNYGDQDALDQTADAEKVGSWTSYPVNASIICYDDDEMPEAGQIVFFAWNYSAMDAAVRPLLLQNAVSWLLNENTAAPDQPVAKPARLELAGNFPNPFNPKTTVRFALPADSDVELAVFDVSGRKVATLVDGRLPAGVHERVWNGRSASGSPLASGIYFSRLRSDGETLVDRMILLK